MNRLVVMAALLCGAALAANPPWALGAASFGQHVDADPNGTVDITDTEGVLDCTGWDKPAVDVSGTLGADAQRVDVQRSGSTVTIKVVRRLNGKVFSGATHLQVKLPSASGLRVSTVSAAVAVRGMSGAQHLQSVNGNLQTEAAADLDMKTVNGSIRARGNGSRVRLSLTTVNGSVELRELRGDIDADTVSGNLDIKDATLSHARIKTISGSVDLEGRLAVDAAVEVSTISGQLQLHWANAQDANVQIESFSGDIRSCFGNNPVVRPQFGPGRSWRNVKQGTVATAHIKTLSGSAEICNK